ncbi:MAG TPA: hypothetical protein V6C81_16650 [Planktothrix sp.]|jgi:hypothetical protein
MINKRISVALLTAALAVGVLVPNAALAKLTISQRINVENGRIRKFEKSGELTKKEADGLRDDMADIDSKIAKSKAKNGGKLSYKDQGKIDESLNKVTLKITKLQLAKQTTSK